MGWAGACFGNVFVDSKTSVLLLAASSKVPSFLDDFYILSSSGLLQPILVGDSNYSFRLVWESGVLDATLFILPFGNSKA